ncbi:MAG: FAD-binding protein [Polyangiales bacterium]
MSILNRLGQTKLAQYAGQWMTDNRGIVVAATALPASFFFERARVGRDVLHARFGASPEKHDERVRRVQEQVRDWNAAGAERPMCTARPPWLTMSTRTSTYKQECNRIEVNLRDILEVDTERMVVRVEPLVNMGQLSRYLVPMGYALKIMVEMEDLTAGGLAMGLGMETTCHRYGLIQETVVAYEIVTADGTLLRVTKESDPELFHALPWSHGTLGFLVALELEIERVRPYIRMKYIPCHTMKELCDKTYALSVAEDAPEFLEATIYSKDSGVIMCGWYADAPADRSKINPINRWYKPFFFRHVETALHRGEFEDWIPLRDFYHRHTRSIFWELEELMPFSGKPWWRWGFGWLGAPKISLLKGTMTEGVRWKLVHKHVVQDIIIPMRELEGAVEEFHRRFEVYPLLVYPIRIYDHGEYQGFQPKPRQLEPGKQWDMFVDLGAYGIPPAVKRGEDWDAEDHVPATERFTYEVGGFVPLYQDVWMTRKEFEQMFDHGLYRRMREKLRAIGAFPEVWDKVRLQPGLRNPRAAALPVSPETTVPNPVEEHAPSETRST